MAGKTLVAVFSASGVGRSDEELHKNVKGNVEWKKAHRSIARMKL